MKNRTTTHLLAFALVSVLCAWAAPSRASISFTRADLEVQSNPWSVAASDFNRDGRLDLAATSVEGLVSVLLGNGDGTFGARANFPTGMGSYSMTTGDVNLDAIPDLLVANSDVGTVSVLLGNGDGSFAPAVDFDAVGYPSSVELGDVNGDGTPDAIVAVYYNVFTRLGNGDGTFGERNDLFSGPDGFDKVLVGDLNGDGRLDLALPEVGSDVVKVLLGNGDGTFQASGDYPVAHDPLTGVIADLNADGHPDLVIPGNTSSLVSVLLGAGDGTFLSRTDVDTGFGPAEVEVGDFNADGAVDLAAAVTYTNGLAVLPGQGDGTFGTKIVFATGTVPYGLDSGDWNGDGLLDLVTSESEGHRLNVFTNTPGTPIGNPPIVTAPSIVSGNEGSLISFSVTASDPDGDGISSLTASLLPDGATFTANASNSEGTFNWTPDPFQSGSHTVILVAANSLSTSVVTTISVADTQGPVDLVQPADMNVAEGATADQAISARDPDGDAITFTASGPTFMTLTSNAQVGTTRTGNIHLAPGFSDAGTYAAEVGASAGGSGETDNFTITVENAGTDRAPVVTAPATASVNENSLLTVNVTASDPDAQAITSLTATGTAITAGATFAANGTNTAGTLSWTPTFSQAGSFSATFTATNALSGSASTSILVGSPPDRAPVVAAPATMNGNVEVLLTFTVTATDPDGGAITSLTAAALPSGAAFASNAAHTSGTFDWTPTFAQAGSYAVTFTASNALSGSASTAILVSSATDRAPVVTAPATATGIIGALLTFTVSANDPDGDAITSFAAVGTAITAGATFTAGGGNTTGTLSWTPSSTGSFSVRFTAANILSGSASTGINIGGGAPVVTAPATASINENALLTINITAFDADGPAITSLTASGTVVTAGATFAAGAGNMSGTLSWTPTFTNSGNYAATFTATNTLSGSASTAITVNQVDRLPVVIAPATASTNEGSLLTVNVTAADPDGQAISSLTATGTAITAGATFTTGAGNTSGTLSWAPSFSQAGTYSATFTAANLLSGSATTSITVIDNCRPPFINAPSSVAGPEGSPISFTVTALDPAGDPLTSLTASGTAMTAGATFTTNTAHTAGTINWTPSFTQAGSYTVTITVCGTCGCVSRTVVITVTDCNRTPVVIAPSHVSAAAGDPIAFTVGAATCGGESLTLTASGLPPGSDFSVSPDQTSGTFRWTPGSDQAGAWPVTFTATVDGGTLSNSATTVIDIAAPLAARAFTVNTYRTIRLASEKAIWCAVVEAIGGSFHTSDIVRTSVVLKSPGTGSVPQISANVGKFLVVGDADKNDVEDATLCFLKDDLRLLFSNVSGRTTVNVTLAGRLTSGRDFSATLSVDVFGGGGSPAASVTPNPLNPSGVLSFVSTRAGAASTRIFDPTGRLVRTLEEGPLPEGRHDVRIDGRDASGRPLATGIYFYRVELAEGTITGRFVILK